MNIDKISLQDLAIFHSDEEQSIFHRLNFTRTVNGKEWLLKFFREPFDKPGPILETQQIISQIHQHLDNWPGSISNGTLMVIARFYDAQIDHIPAAHAPLAGLRYRLINGPDFSMVRYSIGHFTDFVRGFRQLSGLLSQPGIPKTLQNLLNRANDLLNHKPLEDLAARPPGKQFSMTEVVYYGHFLLYRFKSHAFELMQLYGKLDAWYSMAMAMRSLKLSFPVIREDENPFIKAEKLYHLLLPQPIAYDLLLDPTHNFLFLTGANMAGKSTFIKAVGSATYLAHLGMGVPAENMELTLFEGILSNINVTDNIIKGESYFFNEVQRIRNTIIKINDNHKWLVLIDELFKGTNIKDAMRCSLAVIEGLVKIRHSLFILSTHLYEIGEDLKDHPNIIFRYFETRVEDEQLAFNYQLKTGISNDRIGYLILKREKVLDLLNNL
ncbi:MutS-related protein [Flavihumibacter petaseus]|uniref:DNA mismatch repair proteins mutS family domain-containing protein n=1 Tax=Flavihumibacter petaseus NBRC 106054 TaxID=1220578 RepID=A0A0E9N5A9_9BACT|nr:DNA mismatch repair protein MutS [Flavihumibacter petaseus]GAO44993.1 hypothetical protein FPE01S_04_02360 [Flavihumibacter petaseus NBRC 106054]